MALTTAERMARICRLVGLEPILPVRGATEPAIFYRSVADRLGVAYVGPHGRPLSKAAICQAICSRASLSWNPEWDGSLTPSGGGGSISNDGLEQLERAAKIILVAGETHDATPVIPQERDRSQTKQALGVEVDTRIRGLDTLLAHRQEQPSGSIATNVAMEAKSLVRALRPLLGQQWVGRDAVAELRDRGSPHWRQMEWIGFFFEFQAIDLLGEGVGGSRGPKIGRTVFDYRLSHVWDLKAHPNTSTSPECPLNDELSIRLCVRTTGSFGVVVIEGDARYDVDGAFKAWHDDYKGGTTEYEVLRVARGARSRTRKVEFVPSRLFAVALASDREIDEAVEEGWLRFGFQTGMRNEGGAPRPSKGSLRPSRIPPGRILAEVAVPSNRTEVGKDDQPPTLWDARD